MTKPDKKTLIRLYVDQGLSIREIASRLGLHADTVHYHLKRYGIGARPQAKRSQLRNYRLGTIEKGIREKGVRGYAKELGIHENTLRHYLRGLKSDKKAENGEKTDGK
jgi:DNA-binding CsgD family transcriptional regulator